MTEQYHHSSRVTPALPSVIPEADGDSSKLDYSLDADITPKNKILMQKQNILTEESHQSLGFTASVTDLLPAEGYQGSEGQNMKESTSSKPKDLPSLNFQMAPPSSSRFKIIGPHYKEQRLSETLSRFHQDELSGSFDHQRVYQLKEEESRGEEEGNEEHAFSKQQSKDLIAMSFKTSDCYDLKQYDHLVKLINRYHKAESNKAIHPPMPKTSKDSKSRIMSSSPRESASHFNLSTTRSRFNSNSTLQKSKIQSHRENDVPSPSSLVSSNRGFFLMRSKHKLPLPGIIGSQQRNPAYAGDERQFRKKLKDLVCEIGQEVTNVRSSFSLQKKVKLEPRPGGQQKELSPIKVREIKNSLNQEFSYKKHHKARSLFYEKSLRLEQELIEEQKRAIEAQRTMKPRKHDDINIFQEPLNIKPEVNKKLQKLPNLKPIILSPHLVKMYRQQQKAERNKERILSLIEEHQGSTKDLHHQSSRSAIDSKPLRSIVSSSQVNELSGPKFQMHLNTITDDVIVSRLPQVNSLFAKTMSSRHTQNKSAFVTNESFEEDKLDIKLPSRLGFNKDPTATNTISKRASPTFSTSESRINDDSFGVSANNPYRKIAKDLTALLKCDSGSSTAKWLALSIRALSRRPIFTGECDEQLNLVDPGSLSPMGSKKRKQSSKQRSSFRSESEDVSKISVDANMIASYRQKLKEIKNGEVIEVIFCEKTSTGSPPGAREGATMCVAGHRVYVFGGFSQNRFNDTRALDPDSQYQEWHWDYLDCDIFVPQERFGHSMISYDDKLFLFGGGGGYKSALKYRETYSDLNIFDPGQKKWDKNIKPSGKVAPSNRSNHAACELGGIMLLYGGYWGEEKKVMSDFFALDLHTISWHEVFLFPVPQQARVVTPDPHQRKHMKHPLAGRFGHTMTQVIPPYYYYGGNCSYWIKGAPNKRSDSPQTPLTHNKFGIYIFGGLNEKHVATNDLWILRPITRKMRDYFIKFLKPRTDQNPLDHQIAVWQTDTKFFLEYQKVETLGQGPSARSGHSAAFINKQYLMIFGGKNITVFQEQQKPGLNDLHLLDLATLNWQKVVMYGVPPSPRWGHTMSVFNKDEALIFGGVSFYGFCQAQTFHLIISKMQISIDQKEVKQILKRAKDKIDEISGKKK